MKIKIIPAATHSGPFGLAPSRIAEWETETGLALPAGYRAFLSKVDGGYPYPNVLFNALPVEAYPDAAEGIFLSAIFAFDQVLKHWNREVYGDATPPEMLLIGNDPGGLQFLLSLRGDDHGKVFAWFHSANAWGSDGNDDTALFPVADDFLSLLEMLSDTPTADGLDFIGGEAELEGRSMTIDTDGLRS